MCGDGRCDDMAVDLLPRIVARRLEVANARAELDHLDAKLAILERTLRCGNPRFMLAFDAERNVYDASSDEVSVCQ